MQNSHDRTRQLAKENTETAIERNIKDHDNKAYPSFFKVGDMVLLQVINLLNKNQKLAECFKGPHIITKISDNNTATIKMPLGTKNVTITCKCSSYFIKIKYQKNHLPQSPQKRKKQEKKNLSRKRGWETVNKIKIGTGKRQIKTFLCRSGENETDIK